LGGAGGKHFGEEEEESFLLRGINGTRWKFGNVPFGSTRVSEKIRFGFRL
jgi:hypothetical protein